MFIICKTVAHSYTISIELWLVATGKGHHAHVCLKDLQLDIL